MLSALILAQSKRPLTSVWVLTAGAAFLDVVIIVIALAVFGAADLQSGGDASAILVEADATDPAATSNAVGSLRNLLDTAFDNDLKGPLAPLAVRRQPLLVPAVPPGWAR